MRGLLYSLVQRGHRCQGIALHDDMRGRYPFRLMRALSLKRIKATRDNKAGFPIWRTRSGLLEEVFRTRMGKFRPDIVLTQLSYSGEIANWALREGVQPVIFLRDASWVPFDRANATDARIRFVANSSYISSWAEREFGMRPPVIYPPIDVSSFRRARAPHFVTLINPVGDKGLDLVLVVAKMLPQIPFLLVESWPLGVDAETKLKAQLRLLENVSYRKRAMDVQSIYDVTRILIVPSSWPEAFGRVIVEAQACAVPVIGRCVGGIPEAIGRGGIVLHESTGPDVWAEAIASLFADDERLRKLGAAALDNATQGPWTPSRVSEDFESLFRLR